MNGWKIRKDGEQEGGQKNIILKVSAWPFANAVQNKTLLSCSAVVKASHVLMGCQQQRVLIALH